MTLWINGEAREVADGLTVAQLLEALALRAMRVAVEVNAHLVRRANHGTFLLGPGDRVEIVTFVGGG